jgi:hypothetical protein
MIEWRRVRWTGHVAHMGELRNAYLILVRKPEMKRLEHLDMGGGIILK